MKKNRMMRLASLLLVLVLMTSSVVGGTFAKYTTSDSAQDSARVAKWGVTVTANGDKAFAEKYNDAADAAGTQVVSSVGGQDVLAPGTNGTLGGIVITGQPEVMVNVAVTANLTLTGWGGTADWDGNPTTAATDEVYCPIVFTVGTEKIQMDATNDKLDTLAELEEAVEKKLTDLSATNIPANTDLASKNISVSWDWAFAGENAKDTALGNLATAPTIEFTCSATVEQVD